MLIHCDKCIDFVEPQRVPNRNMYECPECHSILAIYGTKQEREKEGL